MNRIYHLVYKSSPVKGFNEDTIQEILKISRRNNKNEELTGLLVFKENYFIQLLEGDETSVKKLYEKIAKDNRHENVLVVMEAFSNKRIYSNWSMAYVMNDGKIKETTQATLDLFKEVVEGNTYDKSLIMELLKEILEEENMSNG